ncbi:MAG: flagellar basal body P-ring formation chaperone FlgA [Thermodesulfobacteriota bacterium]
MRVIVSLFILLSTCFPVSAEALYKAKDAGSGKEAVQSIPESAFYKLIKDYMCQRLGRSETDIMISKFKLIGNKPIPHGKTQFQVFQRDKRAPRGNIRLIVLVSVDGMVANKVRVSAWVDVFEQVVCTARGLQRGQTIDHDDIYIARKNISYFSPKVITNSENAVGFVAKHALRQDTPLEGWMVERPPVVDKGDIVMILAESCDLRVTVPGLVMEKGYHNELVMVRNTMSKKNIYARVLDDSTVKVIF